MGKNGRVDKEGLRKHLKWLLFLEGALSVALALYFSKFPVFPSTSTADNFQMLSVAQGSFPPVTELILYGGTQVYLWAVLHLFGGTPIQTVRYAIAAVVMVSPLIVYFSVKTLFDSKAAIWTAAIYTLSGFVWFIVFNAGLFANLWGLLSSLMLLAGAKWFASEHFSIKRAGVFGLLLVNAIFSHYSVLLVWPPIMLYFAWKKNPIGLGLMFAPILAGLAIFPNFVNILIGFSTASPGNVPQPTFLSGLIPLPTLSFMVAT
jgi:hypothetical protein